MTSHSKTKKSFRGPYSVSKLETYQQCPYAFYLLYIKKIQAPDTPSKRVGKAFHEIAKNYLLYLQQADLSSDKERAWKIAKELTVHLSDEERDDLFQILTKWLDRVEFDEEMRTTAMIEEKIAIDKDFQPVDWLAPNVWFRWVMDRFYIRQGSLAIIDDWKIDRALPAQSKIEKSLQMRGYAWLMAMIYPDLEQFVIRLHYVRHSKMIEAVLNRGQALDGRDLIMGVITKIEQDTQFEPRVSDRCHWCDLKGECAKFKEALQLKGGTLVKTEEDARRVGEQIVLLSNYIKEGKKELKAWVEKHHPIIIGKKKWDFSLSESKSYPIKDVLRVVKEWRDEEMVKANTEEEKQAIKTIADEIMNKTLEKAKVKENTLGSIFGAFHEVKERVISEVKPSIYRKNNFDFIDIEKAKEKTEKQAKVKKSTKKNKSIDDIF